MRGRPRINPRTREEWQEAVNAAKFALCVDSAFQYGLIQYTDGRTESGLNIDRALRLLEQGKSKGILPTEDSQLQTANSPEAP